MDNEGKITIMSDVTYDNTDGTQTHIFELRGPSTVEKPTSINGKSVGENSAFIETDTVRIVFFVNGAWQEGE